MSLTPTNEYDVLAGASIDSGGIENLMDQFGGSASTVVGIFLGIVVLIALAFTVTKSIMGFKNNDNQEGLRYVLVSGIILIIGVTGVGGLFSLADTLNPLESSQNGVTDYLQ